MPVFCVGRVSVVSRFGNNEAGRCLENVGKADSTRGPNQEEIRFAGFKAPT